MKTQLLLDLTTEARQIAIHFGDSAEVEETLPQLRDQNFAVFEIDGSSLASQEDVFRAFAIALQMPKGWYGDEEYAPNIHAFLEEARRSGLEAAKTRKHRMQCLAWGSFRSSARE